MPDSGIEPLSLAAQVMMGTSLAACAGLRAWLPLLAVGILARLGFLPLNHAFAFVGSTPALVVFGVATLVELVGDKVIAVDHALDAASTFVRPVAGTVLAAASLSETDPLLATVAGLVVGGGAALTVHSGKAVVRAKSTTLAVFHGGLGNAGLSLLEDGAAMIGTGLAIAAPIVAFLGAVLLLVACVAVLYFFVKAGRHVLGLLLGKEPAASASADSPER
ncbi:MAG: DUF4126 domain-containing protein [Polyangiales bacterium]